ncbi:MFS transporter, DHA1 family, tetracycline resistance protein [Solimonas aquatica]|uniref:MFS transporter, DHA1 family, tetracycline resistance protein n=1 Tax=Solimonas aquatica TaxID=489703 RepID=A0A1H9FLH0_9GAMM|nr:TCR/Tet family MFS transporter [Solimonas aquatica]SEQ38777.1 MFS transporter, DHA1 family, tetracycline resistance protein [Solimonas aquatica]
MSSETQTPRRGAVAFIFVTVLLDMLAFGIIIPVLPKLVEQFQHGDTAAAARSYGLFGMAWAAMQFIFSPLLGAMSDRYGRRPVILLSCFGLGLDYLFMTIAPSLGWLFVGRVISGITSASFSMANAYIADVTPPDQRAGYYGMLGAAFGIGFVAGPALGGLLGHYDPRWPFALAGVLALANACYGLFVLPESLPRERRTPRFSWARANPVGALHLLRRSPQLQALAGVYFLFQFAHYVLPSTAILYASYRYGWNARELGLMMAATGVCSIIVQALLVKPVVARVGERATLLIGLLFASCGFAGYGLAGSGAQFMMMVPVFALAGFVGPGLQALMTRTVSGQEQGLLQGANASMMGIAGLMAPGFFTQLFAYAIADGWQAPGAPLLAAAGFTALAALIAWRAARPNAALLQPAA